MSNDPMFGRFGKDSRKFLRGGLRDEEFALVDPYVREALIENKRQGLLLAVRARWIALAIIAVLLPFLNFRWEVLYYEGAVLIFALIGWVQLRAGRVALSRQELRLIFLDLALLTFLMVIPNPFRDESWPTAFQYELGEFAYFYVFLAAGTLAYSWRTMAAFGALTTLFRHFPANLQIHGNRIYIAPPRELHSLPSPPMTRLWRADHVRKAIWQRFPPSRHTSPVFSTLPSISSAYAGTGLRRRSSIKAKIFWNKIFDTATSASWNVT